MQLIRRLIKSAARRHAEGADLSALLLPPWIDALLNHDRVAYPLHMACGSLLNGLHLAPQVAALEWMKAAAHAQSDAALARVGAGLRSALRRAEPADLHPVLDAATVRPVTADGRDVQMRRRQLAAMARAGLPVPSVRRAAGGASAGESPR